MLKKVTRSKNQAAMKFARFMMGLQACPTSSAGIERWFSTVGFVWSKTRNRLGLQKAEKLATCYRALRPARYKSSSTLSLGLAVAEETVDQGQEDGDHEEDAEATASAFMPIVALATYSDSDDSDINDPRPIFRRGRNNAQVLLSDDSE